MTERLRVTHIEFKHTYAAYPHGSHQTEDPKVTSARAGFWVALESLFRKLEELDDDFLAGKELAVHSVIEFCEVDIPAFRCGYAKQRYFRKLKSLPLSDAHQVRLRRLAVDLCRGPNYGREMRDLSRLMIVLADHDLVDQLTELAASPDVLIAKKSSRVLKVILDHRRDLAARDSLVSTGP